jgi:hypothetical protein
MTSTTGHRIFRLPNLADGSKIGVDELAKGKALEKVLRA